MNRFIIPCYLWWADTLSDATRMQFGSSWLVSFHKTLLSLTARQGNIEKSWSGGSEAKFPLTSCCFSSCRLFLNLEGCRASPLEQLPLLPEASPNVTHLHQQSVFPPLCLSPALNNINACTTSFSPPSFSSSLLAYPSIATMCCFIFSWRAAHKPGCLPVPPTYEDISWSECKFAPGKDFAGSYIQCSERRY